MTAPASLPSGFLLRPATAIDKPIIGKLLMQLQQEIMPPNLWVQLTVVGITLGLLAVGLLLVGTDWLFQWLFGLLTLLIMLWLILTALNLKAVWFDFWVIEHNGALIACAKLCRYETYSILYDLFVLPAYRRRGLGSYLVQYLSQQATKPLYLGCLPATVPFYVRLGFSPVSPKRLPPIIRHDLGLSDRFRIIPLVLS